MEQRIGIADIIRVLIPSIIGLVLSLSYTNIRDGIFCIVLIIVIEIFLKKNSSNENYFIHIIDGRVCLSYSILHLLKYRNKNPKYSISMDEYRYRFSCYYKNFYTQKQGKGVEIK